MKIVSLLAILFLLMSCDIKVREEVTDDLNDPLSDEASTVSSLEDTENDASDEEVNGQLEISTVPSVAYKNDITVFVEEPIEKLSKKSMLVSNKDAINNISKESIKNVSKVSSISNKDKIIALVVEPIKKISKKSMLGNNKYAINNISKETIKNVSKVKTAKYIPTSVPSDASHCSWSGDGITGFTSNHDHIGDYNICQSNSSEQTVYIQIKTPINDVSLCLIPTTSIDSESTYLGDPRCIIAKDPKKIYKIYMYKNRSGYSHYKMTGVIILKDKIFWYPAPFNSYLLSPDAYYDCMNYLANTGDKSFCNTFTSVGEFIYEGLPTNVPSDASHCSWSRDGITGFTSSHDHIGDYNICQSNSSEQTVYIQLKTPINDASLCIIPTTSIDSESTYLGSARCFFAKDPKEIYKIYMYKNRSGYSDYKMTGAIILKDKTFWFPAPFNSYLLSPDAYYDCMNYLADTGDKSFCNAFSSVGEFVYEDFL